MAYSGHVNSDGEVIWREEIYSGSTHLMTQTLSSQSGQLERTEQSETSEQSEISEQSKLVGNGSNNYLPRQGWEHLNLQGIHRLLYEDHEESSSSSSTPLSLPPALDNNAYINRTHNADSLYSWSEVNGSLKPVESQSNVVSSLELHSKTSTLGYLREQGVLKLDREPQMTYEKWYASKQRLRQRELKLQKEQQREKQIEDIRRKDLAKLCYEKWLNDKARQATQQRLQNRVQRTTNQSSSNTSKTNSSSSVRFSSSNSKSIRNVSPSEIRLVVQSWWHKKQEQQQRQRLEKQRNAQKKEWEDQRRKQVASMAWQKWMSNIYDKPKPVPMSQGMDSLRGTISPLYVNPVPWKHLKKTTDMQ